MPSEEDLLTALADASDDLIRLHTRTAEAEARLAGALGELNEARGRLSEAYARVDAMTASSSWRLTAPLRALAAAARRRRDVT